MIRRKATCDEILLGVSLGVLLTVALLPGLPTLATETETREPVIVAFVVPVRDLDVERELTRKIREIEALRDGDAAIRGERDVRERHASARSLDELHHVTVRLPDRRHDAADDAAEPRRFGDLDRPVGAEARGRDWREILRMGLEADRIGRGFRHRSCGVATPDRRAR